MCSQCRGTEEGLKEEECGHIYPLVYASHRGLASAAGAFLYNKYTFIFPLQTNEQLCVCGAHAKFDKLFFIAVVW